MADLRTPLARARGIGSGKTGTGHFWDQRVTAIALAILVPWLIGVLVSMAGADAEGARAILARPWNAILLAAFAIATFWHAKLGVQVVIEDYVHGKVAKNTLLLLFTFVHVVAAVAAIFAVLLLALS